MLYAAYGSNLHPVRLLARTPSAVLVGTARVEQWSLVFDKRGQDGSGKCNIVAGTSSIHVAVYDLSNHDKRRLDGIEGVNRGYHSHTIYVPGFGDCATYLAEPDHVDATCVPFCWYRELVLLGAELHRFEDHYVARIANVATRTDPDGDRRGHHEGLIESLRQHSAAR